MIRVEIYNDDKLIETINVKYIRGKYSKDLPGLPARLDGIAYHNCSEHEYSYYAPYEEKKLKQGLVDISDAVELSPATIVEQVMREINKEN